MTVKINSTTNPTQSQKFDSSLRLVISNEFFTEVQISQVFDLIRIEVDVKMTTFACFMIAAMKVRWSNVVALRKRYIQ